MQGVSTRVRKVAKASPPATVVDSSVAAAMPIAIQMECLRKTSWARQTVSFAI